MKRKRTTRNSLKSCYTSQQQQLSPAAASLNLPDECWESICTFLVDDDNYNQHYMEPLSLTSKQLLSITNRLRSSFTISDPTLPFIPILFQRFPNLTSLDITSFQGDLNTILCQISKFPFKLKSLKLSDTSKFPAEGLRALSKNITTLTSFTCSNIADLSNNHCVLISDCFPLLEELHLQHNTPYSSYYSSPSIQVGVKAMLMALPKLRKINLFDNGLHNINDNSLLLHLCENCEFLEEVVMLTCNLTQDGIASAIRQRPTLRSLAFKWSYQYSYSSLIISHFIDSLVSLKSLTSLYFSCQKISDELLSSIAMGDLPLRRFVLQYCIGYSYAGVFSLLSKCQRIQHLNLRRAKFLYDHHIVKLSIFLADLVSIDLSQCRHLTVSSMFALARNFPSLTNIRMEDTNIGKIIRKQNSLINFVLNPELKYLYLASNSFLKDESLIKFSSIFPNLQLLDLSNCDYISEEGICQVLKRCCKIRHLNLKRCCKIKHLNLNILNFEVPKLEVLNLSDTSVDDETLYVISKNCCGLLQLLLESCKSVTHKGVKHLLENCTQLREINLAYCYYVCAYIVDNMVDSRPSLRKIFAPPDYRLSDEKRELFWQRGCHIF